MKDDMKAPDSNPKTPFGLTKPQLHLVPPVAMQMEAAAFLDGAEKYGPYNWRQSAVSISTYISAARRHLDAYWEGENIVPDSAHKAHHLAAVRACMAILLDAEKHETLIDDRPGVQERKELQGDMLDAVAYANAGAARSEIKPTDSIYKSPRDFLTSIRSRDLPPKVGENVGVDLAADMKTNLFDTSDTRTPEKCRDDHAEKIRQRDERTKVENVARAALAGTYPRQED